MSEEHEIARIVRMHLAALIAVAVIAAVMLFAGALSAHAQDAPPTARQFVMIGPLPDGRRIWCPGRRDDKGNLVIADTEVGACFADTTNVPAPVVETAPAPVCPTIPHSKR